MGTVRKPGAGGAGAAAGGGGGAASARAECALAPPADDRRDFEPTVEMMVDDFDDERTLDEEEALAAGEQYDPRAELSSLRRESDMPIEEVLALYGCDRDRDRDPEPEPEPPGAVPPPTVAGAAATVGAGPAVGIIAGLAPGPTATPAAATPTKARGPEPEAPRFLRSVSRPPSEEDDDQDYSPEEEDWKKTIMVGQDYQAWIPEGLRSYDDAPPYENEDKLLWNPGAIDEAATEDYMCRARALAPVGFGVAAIPTGEQLRDDEQALYLLQQCGHNVEEALRRRRISVADAPAAPAGLWSEEECRNFENGLKAHGKDFRQIRQCKVRTRSVGELVQFYYVWKKTERHDIFANKARLEKKKYTLHPGHTDYMDRFLEERDGGGGRDSPGAKSAPEAPADPLAVGAREVFSELRASLSRSPDTDREASPVV